MAARRADNGIAIERERALLAALSDDLALPLVQIKTSLEIVGKGRFNTKKGAQLASTMSLSAEAGLQLIDAYRLALRYQNDAELPLEPVAVGAVLAEVAHQLTPYAQQYSTSLEVDVRGRLTPVLANRQSLSAAMNCLAASLIRAQAAASRQKNHRLMFGAHRTADSVITTGVFSNVQGLSDLALRNARALAGRARQPMSALPAGAASGVLIADILCGAMWQPLRAAAHHNLHGLATTVPLSKQLQFV